MAKWILLNSVVVGSATKYAGETIDDAVTPLSAITAAGGVFLPAGDTNASAAATQALANKRRGQDRSAQEDGVMLAAALQSAGLGMRNVLSVTNASSGAVAKQNDYLIEMDTTNGTATVKFEPAPVKMVSRHVVKDATAQAATHNITVDGNGKNVEQPGSKGTYASTATMSTTGQALEYLYDGTQWVIIGIC